MTRSIARPNPTPRAFTLLEVLVVVVIIGILSTLLVLGIKVLGNSSKRQQTQGQFQQLRSLYDEYNTMARLKFSPALMPCPQDVSSDLNPTPAAPPPTITVDDGTVANRYGAAVWVTRDLMSNLRSLAAASSALNKIAPGSRLIVPAAYNSSFPAPYATSVGSWQNNLAYLPYGSSTLNGYGRVYVTDSNASPANYVFYTCIQNVPFDPGNSNLPPNMDHAHWMPAYPVMSSNVALLPDDTVPVLLDGWGNPIIFVGGGTLGTDAPLAADGSIVPNTGAMRSGTAMSATTVHASSPNRRPFFASAGPDGNFSNGDDNQYAFE